MEFNLFALVLGSLFAALIFACFAIKETRLDQYIKYKQLTEELEDSIREKGQLYWRNVYSNGYKQLNEKDYDPYAVHEGIEADDLIPAVKQKTILVRLGDDGEMIDD